MIKFILIIFLLIATNVNADVLKIPFSCWPKELQEEFKLKGIKLDLNGEERTRDSWGFVINEGANYSLYTYRSINKNEFRTVQDIIFKVDLAMRQDERIK